MIDASAPSPRCVWPRITPGCSTNVRFTRSSNSRIRNIWVHIQINALLASRSDGLIAAPPPINAAEFCPRLSDMTNRFAHRHLRAGLRKNLQQDPFGGRIQLVVDLFRFELDDRIAARHGLSLLLEPSNDVDFRGWQSAGFRNFERGNDGAS